MPTILLVDDHPLNRQLLTAILGPQGHNLVEAADGIEALEVGQRTPPDLIVLDLAMPRMGGVGFLEARRQLPELRGVPVILYTATYRADEARALALDPGVVYVLTKPADPEELLSLVSTTLGVPLQTAGVTTRLTALQSVNAQLTAIVEIVGDLIAEHDATRMIGMFCSASRTIVPSASAMVILEGERSDLCGDVDLAHRVLAEMAPLLSESRRTVERFGPKSTLLRSVPGLHSAIVVPISADSKFLGSLVLLNRESFDEFSADDASTAVTLAVRFALVYDNLKHHRDLEREVHDRTEELWHSREERSVVFDAALAGIIEFDASKNIRAWNRSAEEIFGWVSSEVVGRHYPAVPLGKEIEFEEWFSRCLTGEVLQAMPTQRRRKDGSVLDVLVSMFPVRTEDGQVGGAMHVVVDEAAQKVTGQEVASARRAIRELARRRHDARVEQEERGRIARELHDQLGQLLTAIKIDVSRLQPGAQTSDAAIRERVLKLVDDTIDMTTNVVRALRPTPVGQLGLPAAIDQEIREFQERTGIECDLSVRPPDFETDTGTADALYRVLEEAMTNVVRHSGASHVDIRLRQSPNRMMLEIRDNGRGIAESEIFSPRSFGLISMRERLQHLGGWVRIENLQGEGTVVTAMVPRSSS